MTDLTKLKELAERAVWWGKNIGDEPWYPPEMFTQPYFSHADADFLAAANPQAILGLIERLEKAESELQACTSTLPYVYYMDPPDGGDVSIAEQLRRMAKDAKRYVFLKEQGHFRAMSIDMGGNHTWTGMGRSVGCGPTIDDAIDAALEGGGR